MHKAYQKYSLTFLAYALKHYNNQEPTLLLTQTKAEAFTLHHLLSLHNITHTLAPSQSLTHPLTISSFQDAFSLESAKRSTPLQASHMTVDETCSLLLDKGYTHAHTPEPYTFMLRGSHITLCLNDDSRIILQYKKGNLAHISLYELEHEQVTPLQTFNLPDVGGESLHTSTIESLKPRHIITPILIPLALEKLSKKNMLAPDSWHTFLHTHGPIKITTHKEFLQNSQKPSALTSAVDTALPSCLCHPTSTQPLMGAPLKAAQYSPLTQAKPETDHIWLQDTIPYPFIWDKRVFTPYAQTIERPHTQISLSQAFAFAPGDYVLHIDYGLGRFQGIVCFDDSGKSIDCLHLSYANDTHIYIPALDAHNIHFFADKDEQLEENDLSQKKWLLSKKKHVEDIEQFANKLIKTAASRALSGAPSIFTDHTLLEAFAHTFPHTLTQDQQTALNAIITDLSKSKAMNRLLCADVAFGKTEVCMRGAFVTAIQGWRVIMIAPTTLLCLQHFERYKDRFARFNMTCAMLSRMTGEREKKEIKQNLSLDRIDILFTTHTAFQPSITVQNLGLCIIDEEHLFGVEQKETIKTRYPHCHMLSVSATPIPRTLHMALSNIQDISTIHTPPNLLQAHPVCIKVHPHKPSLIRAYLQERLPLGQIFFVVPHIKNLPFYENIIQEVTTYTVLTGQDTSEKTKKALSAFLDKKVPLLLSTNIVGLGLDAPDVSTLVLADAHLFGLSQLYQLKGRIGRHGKKGEALFLHPPTNTLTKNAQKRLQFIQKNTELGSHMSVARFDMQMRGSGRMIGKEQAGHFFNLGPSLYQTLLANSVHKARTQTPSTLEETLPTLTTPSPEVILPYPARLSEDYIPDAMERVNLYRMTTHIKTLDHLESLKQECFALYGSDNLPAQCWFALMHLRILAHKYGIKRLHVSAAGYLLSWQENAPFLRKTPEELLHLLNYPHIFSEGENLRFQKSLKSPEETLEGFHAVIKDLKLSSKKDV